MNARVIFNDTSLYEKTRVIVERTESQIINFQISGGFIYSACRFLVFPLKYMHTGISELLRPATVGCFFAFALMLLSPMLMDHFNVAKEYHVIVWNLIMVVPTLLVIFAVPTTFMSNGVKSKNVTAVVAELKSAGFSDSDDLDLFEKNVEKFSNRVDSRVSFYKWVVGGFWALYIVIFNLNMRIGSDKLSIAFAEKVKEEIISFSFTLLAVATCVVLIIAYKRASELLFTTLEVGCTEYRYELSQAKRAVECSVKVNV